MKLSEMTQNERPQERLQKLGAKALSDTELLAMIIRSGNKKRDVLNIAQNIMQHAGSFSSFLQWNALDFRKINGIGPVKSLQLTAIVELAQRTLQEASSQSIHSFEEPDNVFTHCRYLAKGLVVEKVWAFALNRKNQLIKEIEVFSGTASSTLMHPREILREAVRHNASSLIVAHNHPSGDPTPSTADNKATQRLQESARSLDIPLLDHVIIGHDHFYSYADAGLL